jgi:hypothetical protein
MMSLPGTNYQIVKGSFNTFLHKIEIWQAHGIRDHGERQALIVAQYGDPIPETWSKWDRGDLLETRTGA